jgi:hypothetical protein
VHKPPRRFRHVELASTSSLLKFVTGTEVGWTIWTL